MALPLEVPEARNLDAKQALSVQPAAARICWVHCPFKLAGLALMQTATELLPQ